MVRYLDLDRLPDDWLEREVVLLDEALEKVRTRDRRIQLLLRILQQFPEIYDKNVFGTHLGVPAETGGFISWNSYRLWALNKLLDHIMYKLRDNIMAAA